MLHRFAVLISAALVAAAPASAANIVENGSFAAASFDNWTVRGNVFMSAMTNFDASATPGLFVALLNAGNSAPDGMLEQSVVTAAAQSYDLSFKYGVTRGGAQSIIASIIDAESMNVLATRTFAASAGGLERYSLGFVASSATTIIRFEDAQTNDTFDQDGALADIELTAAIPEPATWMMLILGFGAIGFAARRRGLAKHVPREPLSAA